MSIDSIVTLSSTIAIGIVFSQSVYILLRISWLAHFFPSAVVVFE